MHRSTAKPTVESLGDDVHVMTTTVIDLEVRFEWWRSPDLDRAQ